MWLYYRFLDYRRVISSFFFPRQKWLTKIIPNTWCDKVSLIPHLLFTCLVHYVEDENGLQDEIDWSTDLEKGYTSQEYVDSVKATDSELRSVYNYIKTERPQLEDQYNNSYPTPNSKGGDFFVQDADGRYTMRSCEDLYGMSYAEAYAENIGSIRIMEKVGMKFLKDTIIEDTPGKVYEMLKTNYK